MARRRWGRRTYGAGYVDWQILIEGGELSRTLDDDSGGGGGNGDVPPPDGSALSGQSRYTALAAISLAFVAGLAILVI